MFRLFTLFFIIAISLHALSSSEILKRADSFMKSGTKTDRFRAYNDYKNLYLRAIMAEDNKLKLSALKGIVSSGEKLHIDVLQYLNELSKIKTQPKKTSYKAPVSKNIKKSKQSKDIRVKSSHKLKSARWKNDKLVLEFDKKLRDNQLNYFKLYDSKINRYRYVFDIHASITSSQNLKRRGIDRIKIAQYKLNTVRLVIQNSKKLVVRFKRESNKIIITIKQTASSIKISKPKVIHKVTTPQRVDRNKIIVIDAGHGGKDPGAIGYKRYREKIVVFKIARQLRNILKSRGYKVFMTRNGDKFVKLSRRTKYANKKKADLFISIHANAVPKRNAKKAEGIECYFLSKSRSNRAEKVAAKENSADLSEMNRYGKNTFLKFLNHHKILASNKLAIDLQRGMLGSLNKKYKVKDGGVREGPFWVLVGAQMPAVLVEVGFISHPQEAKRLVTPAYRKALAFGLADGIERYFINN